MDLRIPDSPLPRVASRLVELDGLETEGWWYCPRHPNSSRRIPNVRIGVSLEPRIQPNHLRRWAFGGPNSHRSSPSVWMSKVGVESTESTYEILSLTKADGESL